VDHPLGQLVGARARGRDEGEEPEPGGTGAIP
jgi:hypothetical protein